MDISKQAKTVARRQTILKQEFIEAFTQSKGHVLLALQKVGFTKPTYLRYRQNDPQFDQQCKQIEDAFQRKS